MSFSTYFKKIREEKNLTQNQFAEAIHASNSAVRNIEKERSSTLQFETFCNLVNYLGKSMEQVAYEVFFSPDEQYDYPITNLSKHYLASRYCRRCMISPAHSIISKDNVMIRPQGIFWIAGSPYYRVLIEEISKSRYLAAIRDRNKTEKLMNLVFSETLLYDSISSKDHIKEVRFLLDGNDIDHQIIFNEIRNIVIPNLGRNFHISFVLYDRDKSLDESDREKHYITIKKTLSEI